MEEKSLAIVIPAYKGVHFRETLSSLALQTCKDFTVYIGDDASQDNLFDIVKPFQGEINIKYTRFDSNLGGKDLVAQWQRCIDLISDENWICLFSDDDIMEPRCVECFYDSDIPDNVDVLHYQLHFIDDKGNSIRLAEPFPPLLSSMDFYKNIYQFKLHARMSEFVFRRSAFEKTKFLNIDLAWGADHALIFEMSRIGGIYTMSGNDCRVRWREGNNITCSKSLSDRKLNANIQFFNWSYDYFNEIGETSLKIQLFQLFAISNVLDYYNKSEYLKDAVYASKRLKYTSSIIHRLVFFTFVLKRIALDDLLILKNGLKR